MQAIRIAKKYTQALWQFAEEKKAIDLVYTEVFRLYDMLQKNASLQLFCSSPLIDNQRKKKILVIFLQNKSTILSSLFDLIAKKNRFSALLIILERFIAKYKAYQGIKYAYITTKFPLNKILQQKIQNFIQQKINCKKIVLIENINQAIQGGLVIKIDDLQMDCSINTYLKQLQKVLSSS